MRDIEFTVSKPINLTALDRALRQRFGDRLAGCTMTGDRVTVHVLAPGDRDAAEVDEELAAHDATQLTPDQARDVADRQVGGQLRAALDNRIAWHEANPAAAGNAIEVLQRMQTEWLYLLRLIRSGAVRMDV